MKNKCFFPLLLILTLNLFCEELEITLPTQNRDIKVYIGTCRNENQDLATLVNHVLNEDFQLDGRGVMFEKTASFLTLEKTPNEKLYTNDLWKQNRIDYAIIPSLLDNKISFNLFNIRTGSIKTLQAIELSSNKDEQIETVHNFSDFLLNEIYGSPGIASKKVLFSFKPYRKESDLEITNWSAEIYQTDSLGLTSKRVTFDNNYSITPEFLSDHEFVYVTYKQGLPQIYQGRLDGKRGKSLINLRGNQLLPKVSYDGKYVSFVSDASGRSDVFIQELNSTFTPVGKPMQVYSGMEQTSASPHLSPDNKSMAFVTNKSGKPMVYIASIEETLKTRETPNLELIKTNCDECTSPSYSPDGKMIAFSGRINGRRQIWIYDIKGKKAHQLTTGAEDKENPCFGSDSRHIVYNTTFPTTDLFILEIGQQKIRRLTKGAGDKHYPSFEK